MRSTAGVFLSVHRTYPVKRQWTTCPFVSYASCHFGVTCMHQ